MHKPFCFGIVTSLLLFCLVVQTCDKNGNPANTTTDPEDITLHPTYKGVLSGSDAKIIFADSSKTHGDVTFRLATDLALTYSLSNDTITFYAATIPAYTGILTATQLSIYLPGAGTTLLGTLTATVPEFGPLTGTYRPYGANFNNSYFFFKEDGVDSAYFYQNGSTNPRRLVYTIDGDTISIPESNGPVIKCYLSTDKNAFWNADDELTYVKDTTLKPWSIGVLQGVIPKSEYKLQVLEGVGNLYNVTYGIGFGIDASGNNYYFAYKWSSEEGGNVYEESGSYAFNKVTNTITFKVDSNGCINGSGSVTSCMYSGSTATISTDTKVIRAMINGSRKDLSRS